MNLAYSLRRVGFRPRAGATLVELMVVLVVLGAMSGVVGLAWRNGFGEAQAPNEQAGVAVISSMRAEALSAGEAVTRTVRVEGRLLVVTALPDGRVIGADALGIDPLSGRR